MAPRTQTNNDQQDDAAKAAAAAANSDAAEPKSATSEVDAATNTQTTQATETQQAALDSQMKPVSGDVMASVEAEGSALEANTLSLREAEHVSTVNRRDTGQPATVVAEQRLTVMKVNRDDSGELPVGAILDIQVVAGNALTEAPASEGYFVVSGPIEWYNWWNGSDRDAGATYLYAGQNDPRKWEVSK